MSQKGRPKEKRQQIYWSDLTNCWQCGMLTARPNGYCSIACERDSSLEERDSDDYSDTKRR